MVYGLCLRMDVLPVEQWQRASSAEPTLDT